MHVYQHSSSSGSGLYPSAHVCGSFHAMRRLGIVEVLEGYRPATSTVVVHVQPEADPHEFVAERHGGLGDFVVLTNAALPRTHDYAA